MIKGPVYAPIATLEHAQSPTSTSLQIDTMDSSNTQRNGLQTPDDSFPSSILITDVRTLTTPHTISGVEEHRDLSIPAIQPQESAPTTQNINRREVHLRLLSCTRIYSQHHLRAGDGPAFDFHRFDWTYHDFDHAAGEDHEPGGHFTPQSSSRCNK